MDHTTLRRDFDELGYVHLRGLLDDTDIRRLVCAIEEAATGQPDNPLSLDGMRFASNLYRTSAELRSFLTSPEVVDLVGSVGGPDLWLRWDQAVWKQPDAPEFPWHQDNGYSGLRAMHLQLWVALTTMGPSNGGLLLCPGAHRQLLPHEWLGGHVRAEPPGPTVSVDARAGDLILFSSFLPHATTRNVSGMDRLAYVAEFLPLSEIDASVPPPHFVVSRSGRSCCEWMASDGADDEQVSDI